MYLHYLTSIPINDKSICYTILLVYQVTVLLKGIMYPYHFLHIDKYCSNLYRKSFPLPIFTQTIRNHLSFRKSFFSKKIIPLKLDFKEWLDKMFIVIFMICAQESCPFRLDQYHMKLIKFILINL